MINFWTNNNRFIMLFCIFYLYHCQGPRLEWHTVSYKQYILWKFSLFFLMAPYFPIPSDMLTFRNQFITLLSQGVMGHTSWLFALGYQGNGTISKNNIFCGNSLSFFLMQPCVPIPSNMLTFRNQFITLLS